MSDVNIVKTLDCKGLLCPLPVVKTFKAIREMAVGEILEMISTDPGAMPDMKAWANQTKHELIEAKGENGIFRFLIKKTH